MNRDTSPLPFSSVGQLRLALSEMECLYANGGSATVGQMLRPLGAEGAALAATLLALPFLSPVSLGGLTLPGSMLIALLGWRLLRQIEGASLPGRLLALPVPRAIHRAMAGVLGRVHTWMQSFSRPRLPFLVEDRQGRFVCGMGLIAGAVLLAVPIPMLPLTNTFPALGILCFGLGWAERDGLITVIGVVSLLVSVVLFAALGVAVAAGGAGVLQHLLAWTAG